MAAYTLKILNMGLYNARYLSGTASGPSQFGPWSKAACVNAPQIVYLSLEQQSRMEALKVLGGFAMARFRLLDV